MAIGNLFEIDNWISMETPDHDQVQDNPITEQEQQPETEQKLQQVQPVKTLSPEELAAVINEKFGYLFKDKLLLQRAFTHESCVDKGENGNYERLEYYGDAALSFLTADNHYWKYEDLAPGKLTLLRAANVDREKLALAAVNHKLYELIRHNMDRTGQGDLTEKINKFKEELKDVEENYNEYTLHLSGLTNPPKVLSDIVEALIGAVYIETKSLSTTWELAEKVLEPWITPETIQAHPVTRLNEYCQKNRIEVQPYENIWEQTGEVVIKHNEEIIATAKHTKKMTAKNRAAYHAYKTILERFEPTTGGMLSSVENMVLGANS